MILSAVLDIKFSAMMKMILDDFICRKGIPLI